MGMQENTSRYRMRAANLLPKFGSSKNPFSSSTGAVSGKPVQATLPEPVAVATASTEPVVQPQPPAVQNVSTKGDTVKMDFLPLFETKPVVPAEPAKIVRARPAPELPITADAASKQSQLESQPAMTVPVVAACASKAKAFGGWVKKLNPLKYLPIQELVPKKQVRPKSSRTPVQAELSLEKVKVVRNDLNDTDLDIIPVKVAATSDIKDNAIQPLMRTEPDSHNRMRSGMVDAGQTVTK